MLSKNNKTKNNYFNVLLLMVILPSCISVGFIDSCSPTGTMTKWKKKSNKIRDMTQSVHVNNTATVFVYFCKSDVKVHL